MSYEIREHIEAISTQRNIRDSLINSMVEGVLGINDNREVILSNKMADDIIPTIDKTTYQKLRNKLKSLSHLKLLNFKNMNLMVNFMYLL